MKSEWMNISLERNLFSKLKDSTFSQKQKPAYHWTNLELPTHTWQHLFGKLIHFHAGTFPVNQKTTDIWDDNPFTQSIKELTNFIPNGSSVYEIGSQWGCISQYLHNNTQSQVIGITDNESQFKINHKRGIKTRLGHYSQTIPSHYFDSIIMNESLEFIKDKDVLLHNLKYFSDRLIIKTNCYSGDYNHGHLLYGLQSYMISENALLSILEKSGWKILSMENCRTSSLPTFNVWKKRLETIDLPTQLNPFSNWCNKTIDQLPHWADTHPLIQITAEPK